MLKKRNWTPCTWLYLQVSCFGFEIVWGTNGNPLWDSFRLGWLRPSYLLKVVCLPIATAWFIPYAKLQRGLMLIKYVLQISRWGWLNKPWLHTMFGISTVLPPPSYLFSQKTFWLSVFFWGRAFTAVLYKKTEKMQRWKKTNKPSSLIRDCYTMLNICSLIGKRHFNNLVVVLLFF